MRTFLFLVCQRLALLLVALAFLAVPASAKTVCDPHEDFGCSSYHQVEHAHDAPDSHDLQSHEHDIHSHGTCHVSMTAPEAPGFSFIEVSGADYWMGQDDARLSGTGFPLERPPRA
jgi:hypothetical protein